MENQSEFIEELVVVGSRYGDLADVVKPLYDKLLLPQNPSLAYKELQRMGMPDGEGYTLKNFQKYYNK